MRREQEIALVKKAKEGDTAAFGEIVHRYQNLVYATAFRILKDTALAEDVAQEAFVTAFRSLRDLRTESSFPPWLRKIARNLALASHKEQRHFGALEEAGILQSPPADADGRRRQEREKKKGGDMMAKKMNCGCGCVPPGKTAKQKVKTGKTKTTKKRK
ncbi:MAG: sigma-70 family RNA polymerase sigma factor [Deltaproteobacteria bacterium]|nr:sigma-70 family RNA polymerase sigma factor [Deltaproteobacteria bacterium]